MNGLILINNQYLQTKKNQLKENILNIFNNKKNPFKLMTGKRNFQAWKQGQ